MRDDLQGWLPSAAANNGVVSLAPSRVTHYLFLDACLSPVPCIGVFSAGTFLSLDADQLQAMGFVPPADRTNINLWECFAVLVAVLWGLLAAFLCDGV
jgi:nitrate reductase NapE component